MTSLLQSFTFQETFSFQGDYPTFLELLKKGNKPFHAKWWTRKELKIYADFSVGTFRYISRINGSIIIKNTHANSLELQFISGLRIELLLFIVGAVITLLAAIFGEEISIWGLLLAPWLVLFPWWGYRIQEKQLLTQFKHWLASQQ